MSAEYVEYAELAAIRSQTNTILIHKVELFSHDYLYCGGHVHDGPYGVCKQVANGEHTLGLSHSVVVLADRTQNLPSPVYPKGHEPHIDEPCKKSSPVYKILKRLMYELLISISYPCIDAWHQW